MEERNELIGPNMYEAAETVSNGIPNETKMYDLMKNNIMKRMSNN